MNNAPDFIKGTFIWRLNLPDSPDAISQASTAIASVQNLLDRTVRSCVITSGLIGVDNSFQNWDGAWPYINRATYRADYRWENISRFMNVMRDEHSAWISFHTNITDVNVGLREYPEMREFFEKLRAANALFTRDGEGCGVPLKGPAYVPQRIPFDVAKMPYVKAGDPADIFAIVNYKRFWDSGLAKEMFDAFFARLPYPPLVLYIDVLTTTGSNLTAGLPDGLLGGSEATQREGRKNILDYVLSKGTEPGGESPSWWTRYNWNHGGMSMNDYSRIETGFAQGAATFRGAEWQHVYGNIGAYSLDMGGKQIAQAQQFLPLEGGGVIMAGGDSPPSSANASETAEWRTLEQVVEGFYLTAIQELYHIGLGNTRLPGGPNVDRIDKQRGRVRLDRFDLYDANHKWLSGTAASDGTIVKPCIVEADQRATNGLVVMKLDESLAGRCVIKLTAPAAGTGTLVVRYSSALGGTAEVEINGRSLGEIDFPLVGRTDVFSDLAIPVSLIAGENTIVISKGSIHAEWSDGTQARWDRNGFRAFNGDIEFAAGYERMWPDTWSGEQKIYFYSRDGCERRWKLPVAWRHQKEATLFALTPKGRSNPIILAIEDGEFVSPHIPARTPCVLLPNAGPS